MTWRRFPLVGLTVAAIACDIPFLKRDQAADTTATPASAATTVPPPAPDTSQPAAPELATPSTPQVEMPVTPSLFDEAWVATDTGTVSPGMSRDQVVGLWGQPVAERVVAGWTYLYFRNGCEVSCGTFDVVFLQDGQVVDAIVRGPGHGYAGTSSSPPGREAVATLPGPTGN